MTCVGGDARPADRQARPDDRRAAVRRERGRAPRAATARRSTVDAAGLPRPPPRDARGDRGPQPPSARSRGERVELEPMTRGRAQGRARAAEGCRRACRRRARGRSRIATSSSSLLDAWLAARRRDARADGAPRPRARRGGCCSTTRCAAPTLVARVRRADRRRRLRRRRARHPARARAARARGRAARGGAAQVRVPRAVGAGERARRLGTRRGAGDGLGRRRRREGAGAAADRGRVVPAARPAGGAVVLWVGPVGGRDASRRVAARIAGRARDARRRASS